MLSSRLSLHKVLSSSEIRSRFLKFFEKRGHAILPSSSLVPENDPSVLFNTAGMQPLVPYLLGEKHPKGTRLANVQKCVRTTDIEEIGDNTHATFFEMLGNWSLGDYFKEDAIKWSFGFLTNPKEGLGLSKERLYVTVFGGNDPSTSFGTSAPRDTAAFEIWKQFIPEHRIYFMRKEDDGGGKDPNWWSPGDNGPCGPDTEMFYDITEEGLGDMTKGQFIEADKRQNVVEIWNDVFMEYMKKDGKVVGALLQKNVDTGSGLERVAMVVQKKNNIFDTDLLAPVVEGIKNQESGIRETDKERELVRMERVAADHIRTSVFLISDGVIPGNTDQGYVLRRLIRRALRYADMLNIPAGTLPRLVPVVADIYKEAYPEVQKMQDTIEGEIQKEEEKFRQTLAQGLKKFNEMASEAGQSSISGKNAFDLYQSYGFPIEETRELALSLIHI